MAKFMLFVRGGDEAWARLTPEEIQQELQKYYEWSERLRRENRHLGAEKLKDGGQVVRMRDGALAVDGPYVETKETIGGYYLISAADMDEAAAIARDCPVLGRDGVVEVREIDERT